MDLKAWMYGIRRHSHTFISEVSKFVDVAEKHARICKTKQIHCPCFDCSNNIVWEDTDVIKRHLIKRDFVNGYTIWSHHGEAGGTFNNTDIDTDTDEVGGGDANKNDNVMMDGDYDRGDQNGDQAYARVEPHVDEERDVDMEDMLRQIEPEVLLGSAKGLENFETLKKAANDCIIRACRNHCILYCGEYAALEKCPNCDASRYKSNANFCEDRASSSIRNKRKKGAKKNVGAQVEDEYLCWQVANVAASREWSVLVGG
uniref:Transposase-associated domain-containing protein n=1 Tax=Setaria italica TaxID=4555 RepID=K3YZW9_SETIT